MTTELIIQYINETLKLALLISAPMLIAGLIGGVLVALFQAVTQIQEMTLTFIPKILAVAISLLLFFPWMIAMLKGFATRIFVNIPLLIR
ncbi:MAG: flagellar biosynthesis protein FliQ [bacterium]